MYICYDVKREEILYRCEKVETVRALVNIELSNVAVSIWEETNVASYNVFDIHHLQSMFKGLTGGTNPHSFNREYLIGQIVRLCQTAPETDVNAFEATVQSMQIPPRDLSFYQYVKGTNRAKQTTEPYAPPALRGNWQAAQALPLPGSQTALGDGIQAPPVAPPLPTVQTPPPKYAPPWA